MKKKKIKKMLKKTQEMVDAQRVTIVAHRNDISLISERIDMLSRRLNKIEKSSASATIAEEIKDIKKQISVLRNRTNVDYSSLSKGNDKQAWDTARERCATCKHTDKTESENPCNICCMANHWEAKEE